MFRVSFPGPFPRHEVVVDGWSVPLLHAHPCGEHDESVMLVLDNRLAITVSVGEAERFVPFLADAIAVALGFTSHPGEDAEQPLVRQPQPRPVRMHSIAGSCGSKVDVAQVREAQELLRVLREGGLSRPEYGIVSPYGKKPVGERKNVRRGAALD